MSRGTPVTFVEATLARPRRRFSILLGLVALLLVAVLAAALSLLAGLLRGGPVTYADDTQHFLQGSIGAETASGLPAEVWHALPVLFPEAFAGRRDYAAFGFLYQPGQDAGRGLPIGISERRRAGITQVWFNCAVCHTGTWREAPEAEPVTVAGMPANNLQLEAFIAFLLDAAADPRLAPGPIFAAIRESGGRLGPLDRLLWRAVVLPTMREGLLETRAALLPLLARQPDWGPGRVDTFNPYKALEFRMDARDLSEAEVVGASDFPSIFLQAPRDGMNLHWDGNNASLAERNLSAALGAGVTPETVDHRAIERVAAWLGDLPPPPSPHAPDPESAARGAPLYAAHCQACHGRAEGGSYIFDGHKLGTVEPLADIGTDRARLDSYTEAFRDLQLSRLFSGTPYAFREFKKTDGYANMPLDGLWLRGPYLHNGSVPTLADLLAPPDARPAAFLRGSDVIDRARGGFLSPPCDPGSPPEAGFCFDTTLPGNGNGGHDYGTGLTPAETADLLAYLLTF